MSGGIIHILSGQDDCFAGASCAFGVFDGVHLGHRYLLDQAKVTAAKMGGRSIALTFSCDPDEYFASNKLRKLMSNEGRIEALAATGVDMVAVLPFDRAMAALSPKDFLDWTFGQAPPSFVHVGVGFRFGCKASGTAQDMIAWGADKGLTVYEHELKAMHGAPISATRIRGLLSKGDLVEAEHLLGRRLAHLSDRPPLEAASFVAH